MTATPSREPNEMSATAALHTAARRYCQDRFSERMHTYTDLQANENWQVDNLFKPSWDYSERAYGIFPHHRLDAAIQAEIERLLPDSFSSFDELRLKACDIAEGQLLEELNKPVAREALREELADFKAYIQILNENDLADIAPLSYRRVLNEEESKNLWSNLHQKWGIGDGCWFPFREGTTPDHLLTFHTDYFSKMNGSAILQESLVKRGVSRTFQLHEFRLADPEYEIEISILEPSYLGGEQYCTSASLDWVVYASHESSITIGGDWLAEIYKASWPEWKLRSYRDPYSTDDLRGTWDSK